MHSLTLYATVILLAVYLQQQTLVSGADGESKLQIGIKYRPEPCPIKAKKGDKLEMHYKGTLKDTGAEFDNSYSRGNPLSFTLGMGQVIAGWDKGLLDICEGEKRKLIIPPELGYGSNGAPPSIPPHATLVFEVEAVKIHPSGASSGARSSTDL